MLYSYLLHPTCILVRRGFSGYAAFRFPRRLFFQMEAVRARICKSLWSPGIDSDDSIPPAYVAWRVGTTNRVVVPARQAGNRFLGSLKGLQIRDAQLSCCLGLSFQIQLTHFLVCCAQYAIHRGRRL
jgi:hypothetical protein